MCLVSSCVFVCASSGGLCGIKGLFLLLGSRSVNYELVPVGPAPDIAHSLSWKNRFMYEAHWFRAGLMAEVFHLGEGYPGVASVEFTNAATNASLRAEMFPCPCTWMSQRSPSILRILLDVASAAQKKWKKRKRKQKSTASSQNAISPSDIERLSWGGEGRGDDRGRQSRKARGYGCDSVCTHVRGPELIPPVGWIIPSRVSSDRL